MCYKLAKELVLDVDEGLVKDRRPHGGRAHGAIDDEKNHGGMDGGRIQEGMDGQWVPRATQETAMRVLTHR